MARVPEGYSIRFASQLDIPALIAADRAASELFRPTGLIPNMASIPESVPTDTLSQAIAEAMVLVACDENRAVGFALCQPKGSVLYLDQLSVDPAHGRRGLGRMLVYGVLQLAETHRHTGVVLSTFRDLAWNGPFYRKLGFKELPRRKLEDWMLEIEATQAESLDIAKRCFMHRPVRRHLLGWRLPSAAALIGAKQGGENMGGVADD